MGQVRKHFIQASSSWPKLKAFASGSKVQDLLFLNDKQFLTSGIEWKKKDFQQEKGKSEQKYISHKATPYRASHPSTM